jgi:DNA-binding NtrC family response regulator
MSSKPRREVPPMQTLEQVQALHIEAVWAATGGHILHAAQILGIDRKTLRTRLERLGLRAPVAAKG